MWTPTLILLASLILMTLAETGVRVMTISDLAAKHELSASETIMTRWYFTYQGLKVIAIGCALGALVF